MAYQDWDGAQGRLFDTNGLVLQEWDEVASAVNWIRVRPAATGNPAKIDAQGETNVGLELAGKGTGGVGIGSGGYPLKKTLGATSTWNPANMAADGDATSTTITVTGAAVGDPVFASHDQIGTNNVLISAFVQAADTVRVVLLNKSGAGLDIGSGTLRVLVFQAP